ncbi:MAG: Ig-like domain-containing protein, partial [Candidatus Limnocylindrales bacterium]
MRFGVRLLASVLLLTISMPIAVAQAAVDTMTVVLNASDTAGVADTNVVVTALSGAVVDPGYTGTVHFTSSDSAAVLPGDYMFTGGDAGTHTFNVTFKTAGTQSVTATDTVDSPITDTASTTVAAGPVASVDMVGTSIASLASGSTRDLTATVKDAYGNPIDGQAVAFSQIAGAGSLDNLDSESTNPSGVATDMVTGDLAGSVTAQAAVGLITDSVTFSVVAGPVDHLTLAPASASIAAGGSQAYTTTAFDAAGNSIGNVSDTATLSITATGSCTEPDCTATSVGTHTVTTSYSGKTATATLSVGN